MKSRNIRIGLVLVLGLIMVSYQNCAPMNFSESANANKSGVEDPIIDIGEPIDDELPIDLDSNGGNGNNGDNNGGDDNNGGGDGSETPVVDDGSNQSSDAYCEAQLNGKTSIKYETIARLDTAPITVTGKALNNNPVDAENVKFAGNGSFENVSITARNITEVASMSVDFLSLNAVNIDRVGSMSARSISIAANHLEKAGSFSGTFCASVNSLTDISSLSGKVSIFGRALNGQRAKVGNISSMSSFVSLHDVDIEEIHNGSFKGRIENSTVQRIFSGHGEIYLVNTRVEKISNFSGKIHLLGNSSIGVTEFSSVQIIK